MKITHCFGIPAWAARTGWLTRRCRISLLTVGSLLLFRSGRAAGAVLPDDTGTRHRRIDFWGSSSTELMRVDPYACSMGRSKPFGEGERSRLFQQRFYCYGEKIESGDNDYTDTSLFQPLLVDKNHLIPVGMSRDLSE